MSDIWIPIIGAICLTIIVIVSVLNAGRNKKEVQITIRQLLEKGESITPELLQQLGTFRSQKIIDLRRGLAIVSVGLACVLSGVIINEVRIGLAIGIFPLMLGAAFLLCWKINQDVE